MSQFTVDEIETLFQYVLLHIKKGENISIKRCLKDMNAPSREFQMDREINGTRSKVKSLLLFHGDSRNSFFFQEQLTRQ